MCVKYNDKKEEMSESVENIIKEYDQKIKEGRDISGSKESEDITLDNLVTQIIAMKDLSVTLECFSGRIDAKIDE